MRYLNTFINDSEKKFLFFKKDNFILENIDKLDDVAENNMYFVILELDKLFYKANQSHEDIKGIMLDEDVNRLKWDDDLVAVAFSGESKINESVYRLLMMNSYMIYYSYEELPEFNNFVEVYKNDR